MAAICASCLASRSAASVSVAEASGGGEGSWMGRCEEKCEVFRRVEMRVKGRDSMVMRREMLWRASVEGIRMG